MTPIVFLDTETTGLDPDRHEIWEIGAIVRDHPWADWNGEWLWHLPVDPAKGDPTGLRIGHFYERYAIADERARLMIKPAAAKPADNLGHLGNEPTPRGVSFILSRLLNTAHIVGAVPSFDAAFLTRFLNRHGQAATWHYHLIDVEAMAVGYISAGFRRHSLPPLALPWKSDALSRGLAVKPAADDERHTALGDAKWAMRMYDAMVGDLS